MNISFYFFLFVHDVRNIVVCKFQCKINERFWVSKNSVSFKKLHNLNCCFAFSDSFLSLFVHISVFQRLKFFLHSIQFETVYGFYSLRKTDRSSWTKFEKGTINRLNRICRIFDALKIRNLIVTGPHRRTKLGQRI